MELAEQTSLPCPSHGPRTSPASHAQSLIYKPGGYLTCILPGLRDRAGVARQSDSRAGLTLHTAGEASPVGKDHEGQALLVEVPDDLGGLVGGVREPHLARLLDDL